MSNTKGIYKHFKGDYYAVIGMAKHSEFNCELILYMKLNSDGTIYARPIQMFF